MNRSSLSALVLAVACCAFAQPACAQVQGLDQIIDKLDLRDVQLADALRALGEESGVNLVSSEDAAKKTVACYLQNVSVRQAIESISKAYGLWYREDDVNGVVRVLTAQEFQRDLSTFRDEHTKVFTLNYPNASDVAHAIRNLYGSRVQLALDREYLYDEYDELSQRFQRFDILDRRAQSLGVFGENGGNSASGYSSNGSGTSGSNSQGGRYQDSYSNGQREQDRQAREARDKAHLSSDQLEALSRAQAAGQEPDPYLQQQMNGSAPSIYVSVIRRNNKIAVRTSDKAAVDEIEKLVTALDVPTPQVLLEVKVLNLDLGDDFDSAFDAAFTDQHSAGSAGGVAPPGGGILPGRLPGGFIYQYVNDNFAARLQFLQQRRRVNSLATPMLLVANNEVARLFVGEERPLVRNISSTVTQNNNQTIATPNTTTELVPVGTTLLITPNINADRTVTLRVLQENSEINPGAANIPIIGADGTVTEQAIDTVKSRTVTGTVVAKDGLTLALGGLVDESIATTQSGIPGLMDMPLIGFLFRRESKSRAHTELVVIIRPHVLFTAPEGEEQSRELTERLSIHPAVSSQGEPLGTYSRDEVPRPPLGKHPLRDMLKFQSGLPDGQ
jgi:general secretion pathway protein D